MISAAERARLTRRAEECATHIDDAMPFLIQRGISKEAAQMFSLGYAIDGEYKGRLVVPYCTPAGVVALKYRCTQTHDCKLVDCRKYLYDAGTSLCLYNAQALIRATERVVITEGELDAVCVQAYCGVPAVGYPGVESWARQGHYRLCFEGIPEILVIADGDKVGRAAARKVADDLGPVARVVQMPDGHDSNSFLVNWGAQAFLNKLSE